MTNELKPIADLLEQQLKKHYPNFDDEMRRRVANIGAGMALNTAKAEQKAAESTPPETKDFKYPQPFGEDTRLVSNVLARCALFAAVKERQFFQEYVVIAQSNDLTLEIKGEQFNQDDHDTFLQLLKMAVNTPLGIDVFQPVNSVLKSLNRSTQQEQRRQLFEQISRLVSTTVRLKLKDARYEGHLVDDVSTPQDQFGECRTKRRLAYRINPKFARFYAEAAYTLFDAKERLKIKGRGSELAKWLHLWIIGHAEQYPHKVEKIRDLCGSSTKELKHFRSLLRQSLNLLKEAEIIQSWFIDEKDLVHIERVPSPSQQKHIIKASFQSLK